MFRFCRTKEEAKKLYRKLAHHLHPDKGGDEYLMRILSDGYRNACEIIEQYGDEPGYDEEKHYNCDEKYPMVYENVEGSSDLLAIIGDIFFYSACHKKFDPKFVDSISSFLAESGYITSQQYNALRRIYYSFHIEEWITKEREGK